MTFTPDPRRWSLATRLTLFLTVAMGAILLAVAWLMNDQLEHQLHEKDEVELSHTIATQRDIVRLMQTAPGNDGWARIWVEHMQPKSDVTVRILDPEGRIFTQSPGMDVPAAAFVPPSGRRRYFAWQPPHQDDARYLLTVDRIEVRPGSTWTIQAAEDLSERHELLEKFRARLRTVVVCALLATLLAGWLLVWRGLSPLRAMSARIAGVNVERLHARIGEQLWPSDLRALARSFDAMMIRLQAAFEQLSRFSSDLAHEFRSPITNLVAAASVMLARERSAAEYQDTLGIMVDEGERLSRMVTSMLFLA
ncbi:MAG: two-component sensor histidine kinase, partial [Pseudomonadota bacterium]|nr:two-component sensor histidine kinase [Pseudomonadota bacterium]